MFDATDAAALRRVMTWRRDVRTFDPAPIDPAVLARVKASVDLAPSVGNARPWRFVEIESDALRALVRADFARCNAAAAQGYAGQRADAYRSLKLAGLDCAPVQMAVFTDLRAAAGHGLGRRTMPWTLRQSTAMAIHTMWLAARAENLGLGMVSILDPDALHAPLGGQADWAFEAYLCLGHPLRDDDTPLLHRAGWQANRPATWRRL